MAVGSAKRRRRLRRALLVGIGLLYLLSIPWYRTGGDDAGTWIGLPSWVTVAVLCYAGAALLNAAAWLLTDVSDAGPAEGDPGTGAPE